MIGADLVTLTAALKEWDVAVNAIAAGKTIALIRKGGIREAGGNFTVKSKRVLLFPTYEHQKKALLKPDYAHRVSEVEPGWHPSTIKLSTWADITDIIQVDSNQSLKHLLPFLIWNERFARERFNWKQQQPLYLLLLRAHALPNPIELTYSRSYGGCRSWIEVDSEISIRESSPVLSDRTYADAVADIHTALNAENNEHH